MFQSHRLGIAVHARAAIPFDHALNGEKEVSPNRLRAEIAAPDTAGHGVHEKQNHSRDNEKPCEVINFLWPDFDKEK